LKNICILTNDEPTYLKRKFYSGPKSHHFAQRQTLIAQHLCFYSLSEAEVWALAHLEVSFAAHAEIVRQHEVVDAIYLVSSGADLLVSTEYRGDRRRGGHRALPPGRAGRKLLPDRLRRGADQLLGKRELNLDGKRKDRS
jgi:hypothetical protein